MNVVEEIIKYSSEENKPILLKLFEKYHLASEWRFVARCKFNRYGNLSYETCRVWEPTEEGVILYNHYFNKKDVKYESTD